MRRLLLAALASLAVATPAAGQDGRGAVVHPIWGTVSDLPRDADARQAFANAVGRYGMGPVETMDLPAPPAPRAPELLRKGKAALEKLIFAEAERLLDEAAAEVIASGGAGLSPTELADVFLHQAIAAQKATWKELSAPPTDVTPPKAKEAYRRAAVLAPDRAVEPQRFPPIVVESWKLILAEVRKRPRGSIVVRASPTAQVSIDGAPPQLAPATAAGLIHGDHFVRVEDPGMTPWAEMVTLAESTLAIDAPPTQPVTLDPAGPAAQARRMGAAYALVGQIKAGGDPEIELRLVDATGARLDSTVVPVGDPAALEAAVMRLEEVVRRREFVARAGTDAPSRFTVANAAPSDQARPRLADDPGAWVRKNWPLVTAVGVAVGTALVLGFAVANDDAPTAPERRR